MLKLFLIIFITGQLTLASSYEIDCNLPKNGEEISQCYNMTLKEIDTKTYQFESYTVLTTQGQLYTKYEQGPAKIIFGEKSGLNDILFVSISCTDKEIAILNRNVEGVNEILIFPIILSGTVKPFRVIRSEKLQKSERILYDNGDQELIAISDTLKSALSFNSKSNSLSFKKELKPIATIRDFEEF